ncbi:hypothetical protein GIB67_037348 [Kingdonia uniflora]|uniref:Zinc finger PHD-type domain-containing protein n=1 Tax=Kingdonia uniflora TaxID=39325 RepID=A0A7J7KYA5_9MAGN|nr:hypothetical protein GIB67_037348 [Kingdonia uniflora]
MVENGRSLKRIKKRVTADLNDFLTFPVTADDITGCINGPFRDNIQKFLSKYARQPTPSSLFPHLLVWQIVFRVGDVMDGQDSSYPAILALDIVEEDVSRSESVYCDQCRVIGWSGHPVCRKRYHFIIRRDGFNTDGYQNKCNNCGESLNLTDPRCKSCNSAASVNDLEEWLQQQLEATSHLLHGVVHSNGYGHLLRLNGREGGSKFLSGKDIMNFWDRLCKAVAVRKVSVMDVSKKYGLEYRLLHAVTNGDPWYGNWGYEFGAGSFALTLDAYRRAVDTLPLLLFMRLIHRSLETSSPVVSVSTPKKHEVISHTSVLYPWTRDDVERVQGAMVKVLRAVQKSNWVQWRLLKGAVCKLASPELLNYCLKDLEGKTLAGERMVVHSRCNPDSGAMEYSLATASTISGVFPARNVTTCPSKEHLIRDLKSLYDSLLNPSTMVNYSLKSARELTVTSAEKLLDCKQFVKDYKSSNEYVDINPFAIHLSCSVKLTDQPENYTAPPAEPIVLPLNATIADLKTETSKAFQEVYLLFKRFQAVEITDFKNVKDSTPIKIMVRSGASIRVEGKIGGNQGLLQQFRMERGLDNWIVNCVCGAKDDDGERMLACDKCSIWQHTRCCGIYDFDPVPERFVCSRCSIKPSNKKGPSLPVSHYRTGGRTCKDNAVSVREFCRVAS